jgi:hypothetical protein
MNSLAALPVQEAIYAIESTLFSAAWLALHGVI